MKPVLSVLGVVAVGLVLTLVHRWRLGAAVIGLALSLAAALRLVLPTDKAGYLVVRSRGVDAAVLTVLGLATVGLANSVPGH